MTQIKLCGLSRPEDIAAANALKPDFVGFVFATSRRQVTPEAALRLRHLHARAGSPHGLHCGRCHCGFGHCEADGPVRQRGPGPRGRICAPDEAGPVNFGLPWPALSVCGAFSQSNFPKIQTQNPAPNCTAVRFRAGLLFLRVCLWVRGSCVPSVRSVHPVGWPAGRGSTPPGRPGRR